MEEKMDDFLQELEELSSDGKTTPWIAPLFNQRFSRLKSLDSEQ